MNEGDVTRMQTDTAVGVGTRGAVFQIAAYRKTDGRQLAADLVMSTGVKTDFHKTGALAIFQHFEIKHRAFRATHLLVVGKGFIALFIAGEKVREGYKFARSGDLNTVGALGNERNDGMISLVDIAATEHFVQPR